MPVNVIATIKPKNNGKFPVAEAVDIKVTEDLRLDEALENKADLATVNFALDNKADKTTTTNLQNQINNIISPVTVDAEVINARVGADGTSYETLKARLDAENAEITNSISNITSEIGFPYSATATKAVQYEMETYIDNINLKKDTVYIITASIPEATSAGGIYIYGKDSEGTNIFTCLIEKNTTSKTTIYTPSTDLEDCYIAARVGSIGAAGIAVTITIEESGGSKLDQFDQELNNVITDVSKIGTDIDNITGYNKPNLFENNFTTQTFNGITFTVNEDKSVHIEGTADGNAYILQNITLLAGSYIISGCTGGGTNTYHLLFNKPTGGAGYQYNNESIINPESEFTTQFIIRVMSGVTVNTTIYPMIRDSSITNPTYVPYGEYQIFKPIQKLIDYTQFNWSGKKINVIGDSIVQGSYGNFVNVIKNILNLSEARNYGVGGSCIASSSIDGDYPPACIRYTDMDNDADIILVHAGTNDYSGQIPLGEDNSTDITTFNGALNVLMSGLREKYPTALIIFDSILHRYNDGALTIRANEYRQAIENRCLANHIVFYDCFRYSGFDFVKGYYDHILTTDGLHPNQTGANILGRKIAGFIKWN